MNDVQGHVAELFASCQGEGPWVGFSQLFVRMAGCSLACRYCDTRWANQRTNAYSILYPDGRANLQPNPVPSQRLVQQIASFWKKFGPYHSLAITGGEPLEQPAFLEGLVTGLKEKIPSMKILLETNGLHSEFAKKSKAALDFVSMDIKLASAIGKPVDWNEVQAALHAFQGLAGCVKLVLYPEQSLAELRRAGRLAAVEAPSWDLVLQPVAGWAWKGRGQMLQTLIRHMGKLHPRVRLIPQMHKILGLP